jgi:hypothetical protein
LPAPDDPDAGASLVRVLRRGIVLAALAASAAIFIVVDARSHSVSDTFYGMVVPEAVVVAAALTAWAVVRWTAARPR